MDARIYMNSMHPSLDCILHNASRFIELCARVLIEMDQGQNMVLVMSSHLHVSRAGWDLNYTLPSATLGIDEAPILLLTTNCSTKCQKSLQNSVMIFHFRIFYYFRFFQNEKYRKSETRITDSRGLYSRWPDWFQSDPAVVANCC